MAMGAVVDDDDAAVVVVVDGALIPLISITGNVVGIAIGGPAESPAVLITGRGCCGMGIVGRTAGKGMVGRGGFAPSFISILGSFCYCCCCCCFQLEPGVPMRGIILTEAQPV